MCGLRSKNPDHEELRWCIVVDFDPMSRQVKGTFTAQYCSVASISARGEDGITEHIFYRLTDNWHTGAHGWGTISTEDAETDLVIKNLISSFLAHSPKTSLSQTATIKASILQRTDRVLRSSSRAEVVFKRNKPNVHSSACLVTWQVRSMSGRTAALTRIVRKPSMRQTYISYRARSSLDSTTTSLPRSLRSGTPWQI